MLSIVRFVPLLLFTVASAEPEFSFGVVPKTPAVATL